MSSSSSGTIMRHLTHVISVRSTSTENKTWPAFKSLWVKKFPTPATKRGSTGRQTYHALLYQPFSSANHIKDHLTPSANHIKAFRSIISTNQIPALLDQSLMSSNHIKVSLDQPFSSANHL